MSDGGPAFPAKRWEEVEQFEGIKTSVVADYPGMSLRDWFAGQALAGMAGTTTAVMHSEGCSVHEVKEALVRQAYGIADAMLAAKGADHG